MEEKIERPKRVLNYESTSLGFLQYVDKLEAYANKLEEKINYTRCCKSDSELLPKYWQIKKEFITPELKKRFPSIIEWAFEKDWWISNNIAKEDELEPLSV